MGLQVSKSDYFFVNKTARVQYNEQDITEYRVDRDLGRDIQATILVKWTNQSYHDQNLRSMATNQWDPIAGISRVNSWRHRNQYYDGLIVATDLSKDYCDAQSASRVYRALQPTGMHVGARGLVAYACANKLFTSRTDFGGITNTIENPDFARLHSVEFNRRADRLLTVSSALDLIFELDLSGKVVWSMDIWDTELNTNLLGQSFSRSVSSSKPNAVFNPDPVALKNDQHLRGAACVINNPQKYKSLGLPTNLTPVFINSVSYGDRESILATSFHRGEAWTINRNNGQIAVVVSGMGHPHGFHRDQLLGGYIVTDTGGEKVIFLSEDFREDLTISFAGLGSRKAGLEHARWLQYVSCIGPDVYCAVVSPRQKLTLFNPIKKTRRDISFDPDWGVQMVIGS